MYPYTQYEINPQFPSTEKQTRNLRNPRLKNPLFPHFTKYASRFTRYERQATALVTKWKSADVWRNERRAKMPCIFVNFRIFSNIFKRFASFFEYFQIFSNIFKRFQSFSNVFTLPVLPNHYNLTSQSPFLTQKSTCTPKIYPKNPHFSQFWIFPILNLNAVRFFYQSFCDSNCRIFICDCCTGLLHLLAFFLIFQ